MVAVILSSSSGRQHFHRKTIRFRRRLSDDLIKLCILPLLLMSSLLRFQFVSTRSTHRRRRPSSGPTARLFDPETHSSLEVENFRRWIYHQFGYGAGRVVAFCTDLVCISCYRLGKQKLVFGNPLLKGWKLILDPPCSVDKIIDNSCGIMIVDVGESDVTCKLAIFSRTQLGGTGFDQLFHVFTSSTELWETIQERVVSPSYTDVWLATKNCSSVRGILYAMCLMDYLLWFDPKEKWSGYEVLPSRTTFSLHVCFFNIFGEWNGDLSYTRSMDNLDGIEIWSMTDNRKPCWTKRNTLSFNTIIGDNLCFARFNKRRIVTGQLMPFEGVNLMFWIQGMLYSYNVNKGQISAA